MRVEQAARLSMAWMEGVRRLGRAHESIGWCNNFRLLLRSSKAIVAPVNSVVAKSPLLGAGCLLARLPRWRYEPEIDKSLKGVSDLPDSPPRLVSRA